MKGDERVTEVVFRLTLSKYGNGVRREKERKANGRRVIKWLGDRERKKGVQ
jgi:hypothetical protein